MRRSDYFGAFATTENRLANQRLTQRRQAPVSRIYRARPQNFDKAPDEHINSTTEFIRMTNARIRSLLARRASLIDARNCNERNDQIFANTLSGYISCRRVICVRKM